jgi:UDP-N-acetylglucosamine--N-acetylmuramyl-(pentapeptide) pyrophosphoryl-undecaprenol N-acetylglucosamine transferase
VVVLSGGGTGGHLYPALAIADELRALRPDVRAVFVGAERGIEARILPERGEEHLLVPVHGIDRAQRLGNWRAVTGLAVGLARVGALFRRLRPELVVVTGGYAAAAAGIVAGVRGTPLVLQEQNSWPGAVTKLLTRWAIQVHVAFPEAIDRLPLARDVRVSGNPIRPPATVSRDAARAVFGVPGDAFLAVLVGGSQGSVALNGVMLDAVAEVASSALALPDGLHVLWATGPKHHEGVRRRLDDLGAPATLHVVSYLDDMPAALAAADVALCRAGAMFTAELLSQGLPAVLVPLPTSAEGHQMHNARALEAAGAAIVVPQDELTPAVLVDRLAVLQRDAGLRAAMRTAALGRARPAARTEIAAAVAELLPPAEGAR